MKQLYTVNIDTNKLIVSNKISIINDAINITEKQRNALTPEHIESAWNTALNQIHETLFNRAIDDYKRYYTAFVYYGILCNIEYSSNGVFTITGRDDYKHITLVMYLNNEFNYKIQLPEHIELTANELLLIHTGLYHICNSVLDNSLPFCIVPSDKNRAYKHLQYSIENGSINVHIMPDEIYSYILDHYKLQSLELKADQPYSKIVYTKQSNGNGICDCIADYYVNGKLSNNRHITAYTYPALQHLDDFIAKHINSITLSQRT